MVDHQRRVGELRLHLGPLVVEHPQRVDLGPLAGRLVEVEAGRNACSPRGTPAGTPRQPSEVSSQAVAGQAERSGSRSSAIAMTSASSGRVVGAERLDADLLKWR